MKGINGMSTEGAEFLLDQDSKNLRTVYDGPIATTRLTFGKHEVSLVRPEDPDRLLNDANVRDLNRRDDYMPYWAYVWPGACLLAEAIAEQCWPIGMQALEIGCGIGLAGLVGIASGLRVEFTDYDAASLRFVEESLRVNGFAGTTRTLDWRDPTGGPYPVILGADVLYEARLLPLVAGTIRSLLATDGVALIAGPYRIATEGLEVVLAQFSLVSTCEEVTSMMDGSPIRGTLHRIRHQA